jgi:hypothetical protein
MIISGKQIDGLQCRERNMKNLAMPNIYFGPNWASSGSTWTLAHWRDFPNPIVGKEK